MDSQTQIRRNQELLYYSGQAWIILGIWSSIKLVVFAYLNPSSLLGDDIDYEEISEWLAKAIMFTILVTICALDMLVRLYIGLSAMQEGRGKEKRITYIIVNFIYLLVNAYSIIDSRADAVESHDESYIELFYTTLMIDLTSVFAQAAIVYAALKIRRLKKSHLSADKGGGV